MIFYEVIKCIVLVRRRCTVNTRWSSWACNVYQTSFCVCLYVIAISLYLVSLWSLLSSPELRFRWYRSLRAGSLQRIVVQFDQFRQQMEQAVVSLLAVFDPTFDHETCTDRCERFLLRHVTDGWRPMGDKEISYLSNGAHIIWHCKQKLASALITWPRRVVKQLKELCLFPDCLLLEVFLWPRAPGD